MSNRRVFAGNRVLLPGALEPQPATIVVDLSSGTILDVLEGHRQKGEFDDIQQEDWIDVGQSVLMPGIVDAHVHLNEPGRTEWEGFYTGTRAAASGGVTTVVDMPLNSIPPTTTVGNFEVKKKAARGQCWIDIGFWGGVIPGNANELEPLIKAGVKGFKCFLIDSGVDEFPAVTEEELQPAMRALADVPSDLPPTVLQFHAEYDEPVVHAPTGEPSLARQTDAIHHTNPKDYLSFMRIRPPSLEEAAIRLILRMTEESYPRLRTHIVHLAAASAVPIVREAKKKGLQMTAETCFHYLAFTADKVPAGLAEFKCCPPIRDRGNREGLWEALLEGTIDFVVSDHSPCTIDLKRPDDGDIMEAWGGISTLGLGLSALYTELVKREIPIGKLTQWLCEGPAKHAGLEKRKGKIARGYDADMVIWDPEGEIQITKESLLFKNKLSPYIGQTLKGRVDRTFVRGHQVYGREQASDGFGDAEPRGIFL